MFGRRKRAKDETAGPGDAEVDGGHVDADVEFVDDLDEQDRTYEDGLLLAEIEAQE